MAYKLMIVESPAKTKTIEAVLGAGWKVAASFGHVRDLPQKELGVDTGNFAMKYEFSPEKKLPGGRVTPGGKARVARLMALAKEASMIYLATDPDREGEAIAWHLKEAMKLKPGQYRRITFGTLDKKTIDEAFQNERDIDMQRVAAQEARRALDRLVGYTVSPLMRNALHENVSAGRVQSPALWYVVQRERAIRNFKSVSHFGAKLLFDGKSWDAEWITKPYLAKGEEYILDRSLAELAAGVRDLTVADNEFGTKKEPPPAPFNSSTLIQAASVALKFNTERTMNIAQKLHEGGFISYHRSDSTNFGDVTVAELRAYAEAQGLPLPAAPRKFKTKASAQEGHEAIRPKHFEDKDINADSDMRAVYRLIWQRAVACQMADAEYRSTVLLLTGQNEGKSFAFRASGRTMLKPGWRSLTKQAAEHDEEATGKKDRASNKESGSVPRLEKGSRVQAEDGIVLGKKTEPPRRYTEATLVKELDDGGVGRPSTYASIMGNLKKRGYVVNAEKEYLKPTELGEKLTDGLVDNGFTFVNPGFTSIMEADLDMISAGNAQYKPVVGKYYEALDKQAAALGGMRAALQANQPSAPPTDAGGNHYPCPECEKPLMRFKRKGTVADYFWGCSDWKNGCKGAMDDNNGKPVPRKPPELPKDGSGNHYPCPECGAPMARIKGGRNGHFWSCTKWRETGCKGTMNDKDGKPVPKEAPDYPRDQHGNHYPCPECGSPMRRITGGKNGHFWGCSDWKNGCKGAMDDENGKPLERPGRKDVKFSLRE